MDQQRNRIAELSQYHGIVFDLDGTLVDLGVDWVGLKKDLSLFYKKETGREVEFTPLDQKIHEARKESGEKIFSRLLERIARFELQEEKYTLNTEFISYINQAFEQKIAIYSMNTEKCVKNFVEKYLIRKPDILITKDTCQEPKPTDKDLKNLLREWGMKKEEILYVGNSDNDRLSGEKAGIKTYIIHM